MVSVIHLAVLHSLVNKKIHLSTLTNISPTCRELVLKLTAIANKTIYCFMVACTIVETKT